MGKLDQQTARRILAFLHSRVATLDDPRSIGEALKGSKLGEFWKYRIVDYRVIARIEDAALRVLVVRVGSPVEGSRKFWNDMTEQHIPLPFRKPARLSAAQRKAMIQAKLQDYSVYQAAREAKRKHHVIEQFKNEQLSLWGESAAPVDKSL